ncbi:hypothetical protein FF38_03788, partial [Lucilia cuprina]
MFMQILMYFRLVTSRKRGFIYELYVVIKYLNFCILVSLFLSLGCFCFQEKTYIHMLQIVNSNIMFTGNCWYKSSKKKSFAAEKT